MSIHTQKGLCGLSSRAVGSDRAEAPSVKPEGSDVYYFLPEVRNMRSHAVVSSKGQIVIPSVLRKKYRLKEGTSVTFHEENGRLVIEPHHVDSLLALHGSLKDYPLEETLQKEREAERLLEERKFKHL
ncbi:AbrB/MazE/SpoVT family DNA-binding domain-containing protein [Paracidobacterium acidisoli]|uniref:AbrB/MazE/SpoVT family DNA-binding domain-containing protein n=1 Tax=Paracidobacterium acidisoli TaxID=2303751 RepID=A0A372IMS3_9BACT|nr:AbrB/MazE/SpoVT family DNA-binding domain-containing protein [Paracidobacterium acidisoli]MBT9332502.1 AbrB/MazE/SpoVT family DNA-binding domain-containing protein [Paracidobacterium acidisoli]